MNSPSCQSVCTQISNKVFTFPSIQQKKCSPALILVDVIKAIALTILFPLTIGVYLYNSYNKKVTPPLNPNQPQKTSPLASSSPNKPNAIPRIATAPTLEIHAGAGASEEKRSESSIVPAYQESYWTQLDTDTKSLPTNYAPYDAHTHRIKSVLLSQNTRIGTILHANKISYNEISFIAMQAPLANTNYLTALWSQLFTQDTPVIVDLTNRNEAVDEYYPTSQTTPRMIGEFEVKLASQETRVADDFSLFSYTIASGESTKTIQRYHFTGWPDLSVPTNVVLWNSIVTTLETKPNIWLHCRAGLGRTGCLAAAIALKKSIDSGEINPTNLAEKLKEITLGFRLQRNHSMIQTSKQYEFVYNYGKFLLEARQ